LYWCLSFSELKKMYGETLKNIFKKLKYIFFGTGYPVVSKVQY